MVFGIICSEATILQPNKTPFARTYVVRFDKKDENGNVFDFGGEKTGQVMLRIASPRGAAELVWTAK